MTRKQIILGWIGLALLGAVVVAVAGLVGRESDYARTPILFVHGSGLSSSSWSEMIRYLKGRGYPAEYLATIDLQPNDGANIVAAERFVAPAVEGLLNQANAVLRARDESIPMRKRVDIVAHSMGAVSTRWYAARIRPDRVRVWIALAGANHGTNALCGHTGMGNREMCPAFAREPGASYVQVALNQAEDLAFDETPFGIGFDDPGHRRLPPNAKNSILYYTVRIDPDEWIDPPDSAILRGAGGLEIALPEEWPFVETSPGNYRLTARVRHDDIPAAPKVMTLVEHLLSADIR